MYEVKKPYLVSVFHILAMYAHAHTGSFVYQSLWYSGCIAIHLININDSFKSICPYRFCICTMYVLKAEFDCGI